MCVCVVQHVSYSIRFNVNNQLFDFSVHITSISNLFSSVLLQTLVCEHQRMISGDVCKHFSTTILPKCSDSIDAVQWDHGNSCVSLLPNVPGHFPEDLNSFPCCFYSEGLKHFL